MTTPYSARARSFTTELADPSIVCRRWCRCSVSQGQSAVDPAHPQRVQHPRQPEAVFGGECDSSEEELTEMACGAAAGIRLFEAGRTSLSGRREIAP
ncbi:hypothetical protein [Rhodococcus sp. SJ-2]